MKIDKSKTTEILIKDCTDCPKLAINEEKVKMKEKELKMEWKSIREDGYPEKEGDYLIFARDGSCYIAYLEKIKKLNEWKIRCECDNAEGCLLYQSSVTHWMELPEMPK